MHGSIVANIRQTAAKLEWLKSRARSSRWSEEVLLLVEEMRRVRVTMEVKAVWWEGKVISADDSLSPEVAEGVSAYARQQAAVQMSLLASFVRRWEGLGVDCDDEEMDELEAEEEGGESEDEVHFVGTQHTV